MGRKGGVEVKAGDLVRFRAPHWLWKGHAPKQDRSDVPWLIGLLIEYKKWEKMVTVHYQDQNLRIAARDVQKFGRRYFED